MYVCICRGITDRQIRRAVEQGAASLAQLQRQLPVGACCGRCAPMARQIIREQSQSAPSAMPVCCVDIAAASA